MGNYAMEVAGGRANRAAQAFERAAQSFSAEQERIRTDPDPRNQTPEVLAFLREQLGQKTLSAIESIGAEAVTAHAEAFKQAAKDFEAERAANERGYDWNQLSARQADFESKLSKMEPGAIDQLTSEKKDSSDKTERRAYRSALRNSVSRFEKHADPSIRLWANRQTRIIDEWEAGDEPAPLKDSRNRVYEWAKADDELRKRVKAVGNTLASPQFLKGGGLDHLLREPAPYTLTYHFEGDEMKYSLVWDNPNS